MVEGGPDQTHRPGHVRENLIPKKPDGTGGAASRPTHSRWLVSTVRIRTSSLPEPEPLARRRRFAFRRPVEQVNRQHISVLHYQHREVSYQANWVLEVESKRFNMAAAAIRLSIPIGYLLNNS